jgi:ABC-type antimicrobial peptide transport system permease subunit
VSKRLRELGIRIALGAQRKEVLGAALGRALQLLAFGSVIGLLLGIAATRVLSFIVYQATPRDPLVLTGVVLSMLLLGLLATWIPAQRPLGADPLVLLREEQRIARSRKALEKRTSSRSKLAGTRRWAK